MSGSARHKSESGVAYVARFGGAKAACCMLGQHSLHGSQERLFVRV